MKSLNKNTLPIGAWISPPPGNYQNNHNINFITLKNYQKIADSKINMIYGLYENAKSDLDNVLKALDFANQVNISYLVRDSRILELDSEEEMLNITKIYATKPAFKGILVIDEPGTIHFSKLKKLSEIFNKIYPDKLFYVNLLPIYAEVNQFVNGAWGGKEEDIVDMVSYYQKYLKITKPNFLSYDYYALEGLYPSIKETYYLQLSIIKNLCDKKIPYWNFVQLCSFNQNSRIPTKAEIFWQVNTSLAYGIKGIQYFTYFLPIEKELAHFKGSMIDVNGEKTEIYDYVKKVNEHINLVGEFLLQAKLIGLMTTMNFRDHLPECDKVKISKLNGFEGNDGLIGYFQYKELKMIYLVNNSIVEMNTFQLIFTEKFHLTMIKNLDNPSVFTDKLSISLEAGDAVLILLS